MNDNMQEEESWPSVLWSLFAALAMLAALLFSLWELLFDHVVAGVFWCAIGTAGITVLRREEKRKGNQL